MKRVLPLLLAIILALPFSTAFSAERLIGDCDGNGSITAADASAVLRHVVRIEQLMGVDWYAADVDDDKSITAGDAASILRHVVRLNTITGTVGNLPPMISNLRLSITEAQLYLFEILPVTVHYDSNGASANFTYDCSNPAVVSVVPNASGFSVIALSHGTATVTLTDRVSHYSAKLTLSVDELNQLMLEQITTGLCGVDVEPTEAQQQQAMQLYDYIAALDLTLPYTQVVYAGLEYMGVPYDELDCSNFTRQAYADAGYGSVIPAGSDNQIRRFREAGCLYDFPMTQDNFDCSTLKTGYVFLWVDGNGKGNHSALYLGNIDGTDWLLESATSGGGVRIRKLWNYGQWHLTYYATPLGR